MRKEPGEGNRHLIMSPSNPNLTLLGFIHTPNRPQGLPHYSSRRSGVRDPHV